MTTYDSSAVSNTVIAYEKPITLQQGRALRDNAIAISEGNSAAPVLSSSWHPYDMVLANDGATGVFYDFATNGAVASRTTPTFANGYDYLVRFVNISGSSTSEFQIAGVTITGSINLANTINGYMVIEMPTLANYPKTAFVNVRQAAGLNGIATISAIAATPFVGFFNFSAFASGLTSVTFNYATGNIDAGQMFLYRRRNYISG